MGHVRSNEWVPEKEEGRRIGILGGTFDPVHAAHLVCAETVGAALGLDRVVLMPAGVPSFKRDTAAIWPWRTTPVWPTAGSRWSVPG